MNLTVKKIYWIVAASLFTMQSANILNATEGSQTPPNEQTQQTTQENIPSLTWPLLPGENVNGLAVMFYPHNKAMQKRFIAATMQLSRDINPGFTARTAYNQTTTIIIPELRALSLRHPKAANSSSRLKMSYRLASAELEEVTPAMLAEYEYLTQRNEKMKHELTQINERIAMQQAKIEALKKATLLWLEKQKKFEEEQAKLAAVVSPSPAAQTNTASALNSSQLAPQSTTANISKPATTVAPKAYPPAKPLSEAKKTPDVLTTFIDYTLWVLATLVALGLAVLVWMRLKPQRNLLAEIENEQQLAKQGLPTKSFLYDEYDDEFESEIEATGSHAAYTPDIDIVKTLPPAQQKHQPIEPSAKVTDTTPSQSIANPNTANQSAANLDVASTRILSPLTISFDEMSKAVDRAKQLMDASKPNQAIDLLQHTINGQPNISLEPWLYLLDIYRTLDKKSEFLNLAKRFHHGFNVKLPQWDTVEQQVESVEEFAHVTKRLTEVWQTDKAHDYIQKLILDSRGGDRIGFSLSILEELLMLDQLLEIRDEIAQTEALG